VFDALRGVDGAWRKRLTHFALASVVLLALFYPALSGLEAPRWYYDHLLSWLPGWPL